MFNNDDPSPNADPNNRKHNSDSNNVMFPNAGTQTTVEQRLLARKSKLVVEDFCDVKFVPEFPKKFEVEILSIGVHEVDDGLFDSDIEVRFNFKINDTTLSWEHHQIEPSAVPYHIGVRTNVLIHTPDDEISLEITGVEFDVNQNDPLPSFSRTFGQADQWWGTNVPNPPGFHSTLILENDEIKCEIFFKITAVPSEEKLIPGVFQQSIIT
ncbi:hypothetical protein E2L07_14570 [Halalkalibacterium halodurans]|uniref:hypothetical protein n=1 Tax=Halalkalibacterium halodurans TaxID=86665 RepID=UPI0010689023|nr:hypothetical protein [Halalkalibacterium halodurans]TES52126.1 hypothetical protein E2L07_14570 [Halalkalibacterium halodurans]